VDECKPPPSLDAAAAAATGSGDSTSEGSTFPLSAGLRVKLGREREGGGVVYSNGGTGE